MAVAAEIGPLDRLTAVRICVFCGSSAGSGPTYLAAATELGTSLARRGIGVVYGGGHVGTMGAVADAAMAAGGEVIGVIPEHLADRELAHHGLTELRVVADMHERKATMAALADGFLVLPGGAGTLEEMFEVWTWAQLGLHDKPIGLVDVDGYYQPLLRMVDHMVASGFLRPEFAATLMHHPDPIVLLERFSGYRPPTEKWSVTAVPPVPPVDVLAWVHVADRRLLTVRTDGKQRYYLPGGKREAGESDPAALAREVREEVGVSVDPATLRLFDVITDAADGHAGGRRVRMTCYQADYAGRFAVGAEIAELAWLSTADAEHCAPATRQVLRAVANQGLID
jgi:uncharacterized protein (TIGR00730 family)